MTSMWRGLCSVLILSVYIASVVQRAPAQDLSKSVGDSFQRPNGLNPSHESDGGERLQGKQRLEDKGELNNQFNNQHLTSAGKPCVTMQSYSTAELINKRIFEHWVQASNKCGQHIKLQVCYQKTTDCIVMNVPPYESKNAVLGIQPNMKEFQYDAKEK